MANIIKAHSLTRSKRVAKNIRITNRQPIETKNNSNKIIKPAP
jgi:hypothetical protein